MKLFQKESVLDEPINAVLESMRTYGPDSPEFEKLLPQLETLVKLKKENKDKINPNTALVVAGGLAQVFTIVAYERIHVFASRAQQYLMKAG